MNRRDFCRSVAFGGMALALPGWLRAAVEGRTCRKPDIIFVLFDDMGWGQPPSYRPETEFKTPNLDRLAREGMRFTDAHSAAAVCTRTRFANVMAGPNNAWGHAVSRDLLH